MLRIAFQAEFAVINMQFVARRPREQACIDAVTRAELYHETHHHVAPHVLHDAQHIVQRRARRDVRYGPHPQLADLHPDHWQAKFALTRRRAALVALDGVERLGHPHRRNVHTRLQTQLSR